jgi:hypothetical protein
MTDAKPQAACSTNGGETRCECGQLIAKVRGDGLELKCKRCKRIILISFNAIEGWAPLPSRV